MTALALRYTSEGDGFGGVRHVLRPVNDTAPAKRGKKKRVVPDPIKASADSSAQQLRQFIERYERVDADIAELLADRQDILTEAKSMGFDGPTFVKIVQRRKKEKHVLDENDALLETYLVALGLR